MCYLGYPASQAIKSAKENTPSKLWITYFFLLGVLTLLEYTVLLPVTALLNLVCECVWPIIKALVCVWMFHDTYKGALFVEQKAQPFTQKYYGLVSKAVGKFVAFVGVPQRDQEKKEDKKE